MLLYMEKYQIRYLKITILARLFFMEQHNTNNKTHMLAVGLGAHLCRSVF